MKRIFPYLTGFIIGSLFSFTVVYIYFADETREHDRLRGLLERKLTDRALLRYFLEKNIVSIEEYKAAERHIKNGVDPLSEWCGTWEVSNKHAQPGAPPDANSGRR